MPNVRLRAFGLLIASGAVVAAVVIAVSTGGREQEHYVEAFEHSYQSSHFELATNIAELDLADLAEHAETARTRAIEVLGKADSRSSKIPMYILASKGAVFALEERYGWVGPVDPRLKRKRTAGGFYREFSMIAFSLPPAGRLKEMVAHEVTHAVVAGITSRCPALLDEGAALYVSELTASDDAAARERWTRYKRSRAKICASAIREGTVQDLKTLLNLDYWEFRGESTHLNHILGRCLVKALVESRAPSVRGRLPSLLVQLRDKDPWMAFCDTYDASTVRALWLSEVHAAAGTVR